MPYWRDIWDIQFFHNSVGAWAIGLGALLLTFTVLPLFRRLLSIR